MFTYAHFTKAELIQLEQKYQIPQKKEHFKILSILYQLQYRFKEEKLLLKNAKKYFPTWQYIQERESWYKIPYLERTTPRKKVFFKEDDENVPTEEVRNQLCIVTGGDSKYFEMLVELCESLKATKYYKNVQIAIFDCGLKPEEINLLKEKFGCIVKDPGWDMPVRPGTPNYIKSILARIFMKQHFPGFNYYMWLDSDMWVQGEWALNDFVNLALKQGLSLCQERKSSLWYRINCFGEYHSIPAKDYLYTLTKPLLNSGAFCIDLNYEKKWREYVTNNIKIFQWATDQNSQNYIYHKNHLKPLLEDQNYLHHQGFLVNDDGTDVLYHPETRKPLGVIHLAGNQVGRYGNNPDMYLPVATQQKDYYYPRSFMIKRYAGAKYWHKLDKRSISIRYRVEKINVDKLESELSELISPLH